MKLIAICTIFTAAGRVAPGGLFSVETADEGRNLIARNFAREPKADELAALGGEDAAAADAAPAAAESPAPESAAEQQPEPAMAPAAPRKR
jgi:hypothetical protein